jgi:hypothetical protein
MPKDEYDPLEEDEIKKIILIPLLLLILLVIWYGIQAASYIL